MDRHASTSDESQRAAALRSGDSPCAALVASCKLLEPVLDVYTMYLCFVFLL